MGRPIKVKHLRSARNIIREHLQFNRMTIHHDLSRMLGVSPLYAGTLMRRNKCYISPDHIEAFIAAMKLDDLDANELRLYAARDAGWNIDITKVRGFNAS